MCWKRSMYICQMVNTVCMPGLVSRSRSQELSDRCAPLIVDHQSSCGHFNYGGNLGVVWGWGGGVKRVQAAHNECVASFGSAGLRAHDMEASIGDGSAVGRWCSTADCWRHVLMPTVSEGSAMPLGKSCGFPVWQDGIWKCVLVTSLTAAWLAGSC